MAFAILCAECMLPLGWLGLLRPILLGRVLRSMALWVRVRVRVRLWLRIRLWVLRLLSQIPLPQPHCRSVR